MGGQKGGPGDEADGGDKAEGGETEWKAGGRSGGWGGGVKGGEHAFCSVTCRQVELRMLLNELAIALSE